MERRLSNRISSRDFCGNGPAGRDVHRRILPGAGRWRDRGNKRRPVRTDKERTTEQGLCRSESDAGYILCEHGTYLIAYSKKALAFFFCTGTGKNKIIDDLSSKGISAEKPQDHSIGKIPVQRREFPVNRIKKP